MSASAVRRPSLSITEDAGTLFELMLWLWSVCEGHGGWRLVAGRDKRPLRLLPRQLCHGDTADGESWSELIACAQPGTAPLLGPTFTTSELSACVLPQNEIKISSTFFFFKSSCGCNWLELQPQSCQLVPGFIALPRNDSLNFPPWKEVVKCHSLQRRTC